MAPRRGPKSRKPSQSGPPAGSCTVTEWRPPPSVDPATAAYERRGGCGLDGPTEQLLRYIYTELLPAFPAVKAPRFASLPARDGVDRISLLPDALLRNIVSRLFVTEAARTAVFASRWRRVWLSTPLVLSDAYISPSRRSPPITASVNFILEAHPGPFRCVHLVSSQMDAHQAQLARWLELLAAKGVQELVLLNRPLPLDVPLPAALFSVTTLTRLYIGLWKFPGVAMLPRGTSFPHLSELGICSVLMEDGDIEAIVARSPVLKVLNIQGSNKGLRLRLVSQSIRCVQICDSVLESITVVRAPRLDRLIMEGPRGNTSGLRTRVMIGDAPRLHALGILELGNHILETRDLVLAGMRASTSTICTSVKILSLSVRFGNHNDVKMVPTFLRCFPNLARLHITSGKSDFEAGSTRLNLKFWELANPPENVKSCIRLMSFCEFRGEIGEVAFLKFFFRSARVLAKATISMANPSFTPFCTHEAFSKATKATEGNSCYTVVLGSRGPEGGKLWSFKTGTDYSFVDPFSPVEMVTARDCNGYP